MDAIKKDYRAADLDAADRAMLDYVRKLTLAPATTSESDIVALREAGFGDKAILEINQIAGFFAWCNRTVDGLGVELEAFWDDPDATNV
ncbi:MAG: peroxidase [Gemmatimonadetes bacterium]|nr:peroxidase [Gemmatimonadota bacterium]MYG85572.1 peroxidase [Gemmatimonadota bacterium]MYJ89861.1 peroxidase [Gemmatimonadota bacterium]